MGSSGCPPDTYRDTGSWLCMHCGKICEPWRRLAKRCQKQCPDYWDMLHVTENPVKDSLVASELGDGGGRGGEGSSAEAVIPWLTMVLLAVLALSVVVGAVWYSKRRRTSGRRDTDTNDLESQTDALMTRNSPSPAGSGTSVNQPDTHIRGDITEPAPVHQASGANRFLKSSELNLTFCVNDDALSCYPLDLRSTEGDLREDINSNQQRENPDHPGSDSYGPLGSSFLKGSPQTRR